MGLPQRCVLGGVIEGARKRLDETFFKQGLPFRPDSPMQLKVAADVARQGIKTITNDEIYKSAEFQAKRDQVMAVMDSIPGLVCPRPQGAFYVFPNVKALYGKSFQGKAITGSVALTPHIPRLRAMIEAIRAAVADAPVLRVTNRDVPLPYAAKLEKLALLKVEDVIEAAFRAIKKAGELIDMSRHKGEHPRMGATDVCPLSPPAPPPAPAPARRRNPSRPDADGSHDRQGHDGSPVALRRHH